MRSSSKVTEIEFLLTRTFTPASPIARPHFLHGRSEVLANIRRAWTREGAAVALYGLRGAGKTSVIKVASSAFKGQVFYHSASAGDNFESIASDMLHHFNRSPDAEPGVSWAPTTESPFADRQPLRESGILERALTPHTVAQCLPTSPTLLIIDDFERIEDRKARRAFADLIKKISDARVPARLTFVGIGDHIRDLIEDHRSVSRQTVALEVPELSPEDIHSIILRGAKTLGIEFEQEAADQIERLSANMPYRAHLLSEGATHCLLASIRQGVKSKYVVGVPEVRAAVEYARKSGQYPLLPERRLVRVRTRLPWNGGRVGQEHGSEFSRTPHTETPSVPSIPSSSSAVTK